MESLCITGADIVTPKAVLRGGTVRVENGVITEISDTRTGGGDDTVVDAAGKILVPGLIDLHNHGRMVADAMDATRASLAVIAKNQLRHGVTGFLITTRAAPLDRTLRVIENAVAYIRDPEPDGATPLGLYLEGPFFADAKKGAQRFEDRGTVDLGALDRMLDAGDGLIRVVSLAPELTGAAEAIRRIIAAGAVAAAGHTDCDYENALTAIEAGIRLGTHTFNAMRPLTHRDPSILGACLTDRRVFCEAIVDGIHLHPATVALLLKMKGPDRMILVSDSVAAAGIPAGTYEYGGRKVVVKDGAVRLEDGTLAGSTLSLDAALRNVMRFTGCSLRGAVRMAAATPAALIGCGAHKGSVAVGMDADFALLDIKRQVSSVFLGGRKVF